jgi:hypothetical protein
MEDGEIGKGLGVGLVRLFSRCSEDCSCALRIAVHWGSAATALKVKKQAQSVVQPGVPYQEISPPCRQTNPNFHLHLAKLVHLRFNKRVHATPTANNKGD